MSQPLPAIGSTFVNKWGVEEVYRGTSRVRQKLKELVKEGALKSTSAVFPMLKRVLGAPVRYFIPDSENL